MVKMFRTIKRTVLFLFGVLLILCGVKGNLVGDGVVADTESSRATQEA